MSSPHFFARAKAIIADEICPDADVRIQGATLLMTKSLIDINLSF